MGKTSGEVTFEDIKRMTQTHLCAQCEGALIIRWNHSIGDYELVCGRNPGHQGYQAIIYGKKALARGQGDQELGPGGQRDIEQQLAKRPELINRCPTQDVATHQTLSPSMVEELLVWGTSIGLNAVLGHVCLYFGKPYVTIDGYYYQLAKRTPEVKVGCRPCTTDERKALAAADSDIWWIAEAWLGTTKLPTVGYGLVTGNEQVEMSEKHPGEFRAPVVHSHPQRMAEKRAEWQLLRKIVPLDIEGGTDA